MKTRLMIVLPIILVIVAVGAVYFMQDKQGSFHAAGVIQSVEENANGSLTLTLRSTTDFVYSPDGELGEPYEVILPKRLKSRTDLNVGEWILYSSKDKDGVKTVTDIGK